MYWSLGTIPSAPTPHHHLNLGAASAATDEEGNGLAGLQKRHPEEAATARRLTPRLRYEGKGAAAACHILRYEGVEV